MTNLSAWSPRALALLRIVTGLLFLEHATMKFFHFPAPLMPGPLPSIFVAPE
jgi:putative oxidoreductase